MQVVGCKIRRDRAELFKQMCRDRGTNVNSVLSAAVDAFISGADVPEIKEDRGPMIPPETLEAATAAADRAGEEINAFLLRAVQHEAERDQRAAKMGLL